MVHPERRRWIQASFQHYGKMKKESADYLEETTKSARKAGFTEAEITQLLETHEGVPPMMDPDIKATMDKNNREEQASVAERLLKVRGPSLQRKISGTEPISALDREKMEKELTNTYLRAIGLALLAGLKES